MVSVPLSPGHSWYGVVQGMLLFFLCLLTAVILVRELFEGYLNCIVVRLKKPEMPGSLCPSITPSSC